MTDQDLLRGAEEPRGAGPEGAPLVFSCPRCSVRVSERFYGPCRACRDELAEVVRTEAREVRVEVYTPRMHVVPNHVATKE